MPFPLPPSPGAARRTPPGAAAGSVIGSAAPSIVFVNRVHPPDAGATGRLVADLARGLAAAGWRVTVLANGPPETRREAGYVVRRIGGPADGRRARDAARQAAALAVAVARLAPVDTVVVLSDPPLLPLLSAVARRRCRVLLHWSMDVYPELLSVVGRPLPAVAHAALARLRDRALARYDRVVVLGDCMSGRLGRRLDGRIPVTVCEPWPDPAGGGETGSRSGRGDLRRRLLAATGASSLAIYAGTMGRAHPVAALHAAVRIAADRRVRGLAAPGFAFVGAGAGMAALRDMLDPDLPGVVFLPPRPADSLAELLSAADVHLATLADAAEGLMVPCKVVGALAAGRPVVFAGPAGCAAGRRTLAGGGLVVAPTDGMALLDAATALAGEAGAARRAREARARAAVADLNADRAVDAWLAMLAAHLPATGPAQAVARSWPRGGAPSRLRQGGGA